MSKCLTPQQEVWGRVHGNASKVYKKMKNKPVGTWKKVVNKQWAIEKKKKK